MKTIFLRALEADDKSAALRAAIHDPAATLGSHRFEVDTTNFEAVPRSPFAYWVSDRLRDLFSRLPLFEADGRTAKQGIATADDFRFVRGWWEVPSRHPRKRWIPIVKGGVFSPYYASVPVVVNWEKDGAELKAWAGSLYNESHWSRILKNTHLFHRAGLTWPLRGIRFSAQAVPQGSAFSVAGKMAFVEHRELTEFLALFNALPFDRFIAFFAGKVGGVQYEVGLIQSVPVPNLCEPDRKRLQALARRAWSCKRSLDTRVETSHAFMLPALLQARGETLSERTDAWVDHVRTIEAALAATQAEIDERCFELYGIDEADRRGMEAARATEAELGPAEETTKADYADAEAEGSEEEAEIGAAPLAGAMVSWAVGVSFGRFDVRLATGERPSPPEPEPFDPLPPSSPGMLTGEDGLPLEAPPLGYPIAFPRNGILADDPGDRADITGRVRAVFDYVFGADADGFWAEASQILRSGDSDLRRWLSRSLFDDTIRRYSKSRRKAPIYWQLATPSANYSIWLYYHRLTKDTFYTVLSDHVDPKLQHEERRLGSLLADGGDSPNARQRRQIAEQETLVEELRAFREETARIAPLWNPNHDDGVIINFAPLWRLVPQHRAWQRECKACWDKLVAGDYDWSHLAMHLWPERVVPKCADDRSLAIAHGLEDVFWFEDADGKWKKRVVPARPVEELVRERTSPAVKAALKSLLEAPAANGGSRRGQRRTAR